MFFRRCWHVHCRHGRFAWNFLSSCVLNYWPWRLITCSVSPSGYLKNYKFPVRSTFYIETTQVLGNASYLVFLNFSLFFAARSILRRSKVSGKQSKVLFDQVLEFSFPLCQGFTSVPSHGGATLGMRQRHSALQRYTLAEHALQQRHRRRERLRERRREERFQTLKHKVSLLCFRCSIFLVSKAVFWLYLLCWSQLITSGAIDEREAEGLTSDQMLLDDDDVHVSDADLESGVFLLPYSSKQRQALLLAAGVKRIDREEKRQLHALRLSREACGCDCRGFCEPETCACSLAGIKCQVGLNKR